MAKIGRHVLYADRPIELNWQSVGIILNDVMPLHKENAEQADKLYSFYRGEQKPAIQRLTRNGETIEHIVENIAFEISEFHKSYGFSRPPKYVSVREETAELVAIINKYARLDGLDSKTLGLASWFLPTGHGYKISMPKQSFTIDEAPFYTTILDPRQTFVVYDKSDNTEILAGKIVKIKNPEKKDDYIYRVGVYTANSYFEWSVDDEEFDEYDEQEPETRYANGNNINGINGLGVIPITEFMNNESRIGIFEPVLDILHAYNLGRSDGMHNIHDIAKAHLVIIGAELEIDPATGKVKPLQNGGTIVLTGSDPQSRVDAKFITNTLDQAQLQLVLDSLRESAYRITATALSTRGSGGGGNVTGQAMHIMNDWAKTEGRARISGTLFAQSEMKQLKVQLEICRAMIGVDIRDLTLSDIKVSLMPNRSENLVAKAQTLRMLKDSDAMSPRRALDIVELTDEPDSVYTEYLEYRAELQRMSISEMEDE